MASDKWVEGGGSGGGGSRGGGSSGGGSGSGSSGKSGSSGSSGSSGGGSSSGGGGGSSSGGGGSNSKTQMYADLEKKLRPLFETEWNDLDGDKPKKWFTDRYGLDSYEKLLEEFLAGPHDDKWAMLDQKDDANFTEKAGHARAIAYMDAWWRDLASLYGMDEINTLAEQKHGVGKWLSQDPEILLFLTPKPT